MVSLRLDLLMTLRWIAIVLFIAFKDTKVSIFAKALALKDGRVSGLNMKGFAEHVTKNDINFFIDEAKSIGADGTSSTTFLPHPYSYKFIFFALSRCRCYPSG